MDKLGTVLPRYQWWVLVFGAPMITKSVPRKSHIDNGLLQLTLCICEFPSLAGWICGFEISGCRAPCTKKRWKNTGSCCLRWCQKASLRKWQLSRSLKKCRREPHKSFRQEHSTQRKECGQRPAWEEQVKGIQGKEVADEATEDGGKSLWALSCRKGFGHVLHMMWSQWRVLMSLAAVWRLDLRKARVKEGLLESASMHPDGRLRLGRQRWRQAVRVCLWPQGDPKGSDELVGGFPGGSDGKASACNAGDLDSIPGSGRSPWEGNGNPLQYSCLENSMDRGAW